LDALAPQVDERVVSGEPGIVSCSDVERKYRQITIGIRKGLTLVDLQGDDEMFTDGVSRLYCRYESASLLQGQFDTIEKRTNDENAGVISSPGTIAKTTLDLLNKVAAAQVRQGTADASTAMSSADARRPHERT
jgi:gluconokinase